MLAEYPDYEHNDRVVYQKARAYDELGRTDEAMEIYRAAMKAHPDGRALVHGYLDLQLQKGRAKDVLAELDDRLRSSSDDPRREFRTLESRDGHSVDMGLGRCHRRTGSAL